MSANPAPSIGPIVSLQAHILQQQSSFPESTGTLSWILSALSISAKIIASKVRRARLENGILRRSLLTECNDGNARRDENRRAGVSVSAGIGLRLSIGNERAGLESSARFFSLGRVSLHGRATR